jgi:hypothetical protein
MTHSAGSKGPKGPKKLGPLPTAEERDSGERTMGVVFDLGSS